MSFLIALVLLFLAVAGYQLYFAYRRHGVLSSSWEQVLSAIEPVDLEGLRSIAECYLQPDQDQLRIEPDEMWKIVGGLEGVSRLKANAKVMLNLAVFAERWNEEQGPVISEMIRRDAVRLKKAVRRIELAFFLHVGLVRLPFQIQEAASSYYLIRRRLFGLYYNSHMGLLPRLEAAL